MFLISIHICLKRVMFDCRYIYHNTEAGKYFLTAAEVMEEKNTAFVQGVINRYD